MKNGKLAALLNTPLGVVIVVGAAIAAVELLIMLVILPAIIPEIYRDFADPILLVIIVAPALYFLVFRKIQESEERFRQIEASAQDAIVIVNEQGVITDWNPAAQKMFQYSREEALGQPMHRLIAPPRYHEDAARGFARFEETGTGPLIGKTTEIMARRKDGSEFPAEHSISAIKLKGRWHAVGILRDLTERKQAEKVLLEERNFAESIISTAQAIVLSLDAEGRIVSFNPYMENLSGWRLEEVRGKDWFSTFLPERNREATRKLFQTATGGTRTRGNVDVLLTRDGRELQIEWYDTTLKDSGGKVTGLLAIGQDVTERKQRENEMQELLTTANQSRQVTLAMIEDQRRADELLRHLNAELENKVLARTADLEHARLEAEQANLAKSSFLAAMSHEIRTPMNGVIGMIDVLHQSSLHGFQVEMVDLIRESAYSLLGIINDILDFSKIEAGKLEIEHAPTRVAEVVENVCGMLDSMATKKSVELTLFTDPVIPAEVLGDTLRLRQVLVNLVNNAIKFSSKQQAGRVSVRAVLVESTPEQATLELRITDNGIGMDEKTVAGLFTPFTQADISTTRRFGGTGLGLSIANRLVELMGGKITVQSEPGKGSTFTVRLSFALPPEQPGEEAYPHPNLPPFTGEGANPLPRLRGRVGEGAGGEGNIVAGLSCLVVGGTESLAGDMSAYLAHAGAVVEQAPNLSAAGELAGTLPPGTWVWVIDADGKPPVPDELRAAARPEQETHFVIIGRGLRRKPRVQDTGLVLVDGNVLTRGTLLKAVAVAAGRIQVEQEAPQPGKGEAEFKPPSRDEALRQGRLILVAEDNETNQKVILRQLALLRFAADIAENGRIALERWRNGNYGMLLADLHMPEMDGYELTTAIRAAEVGAIHESPVHSHIPIVALTANALKGEAEHCRAIGMDDYLSKPVQLADLKTTLEKWLPAGADDAATGEIASTEPIDTNPDNPLARHSGEGRNPARTNAPRSGQSSDVAPLSREIFNQLDSGLRRNDGVSGINTVRAEPVEAHSPFDKANELQTSASVPVDVNVLKKLVGDDEEIIRDFLHDFRLSSGKIAVELRAACAAGQAAAAGALAHKLKSSARSVGALALGELCAAMEQAGKAGDMATLTALLPRFELELESVERFLEGY